MISTAHIIGRTHRLYQQNRQDVAAGGAPAPGMAFGLALDGCGSKVRDGNGRTHPSQNEVGAQLLGAYAAAWLRQQLSAADGPRSHDAVCQLLTDLHHGCRDYLQQLAALPPWPTPVARTQFIAGHLLTTLVGFVLTPETAVCFWRGDGYLAINDTVLPLDAENRPDYLAYDLLPEDGGNGRFHTLTVINRPNLHRLAAATDGWSPPLLHELAPPRPSLALQRWVNAQARVRGNFEDDGAVAVWYGSERESGS